MRTLFPLALVGLLVLALPGAAVFTADLLGHGPAVNGWLETRFGVSHHLAIGPAAAAALFAVPPVLILLYFLRLKRAPVPVPSTFLWHKSVEDLHVNRLLQWLRRNVLLLLQLLAVLLLIYGVLGPRRHGQRTGGRHYILLIDHSLSMSATDVAPDRLTWAKGEALKAIDAASDADSGMVIAFADAADIRQSYTTNRAALRRAVEGIRPTFRPTRLDEALALAASLANPDRSTENEVAAPPSPEPGKERQYVAAEGMAADVHLFSDGKFPPVPGFALANLSLTYHTPPGGNPDGSSDNLAVLRATAERDPDDPSTVVCRAVVRNYRGTPADGVKVRLDVVDAGGRLVAGYDDPSPAPVPANGERGDVAFTVPDVADATDRVLRVRLDGAADALPADDDGWVVLGVARKARVLYVGPGEPRLRHFFDSPSAKKLADVTYYGPDVLAPAADPSKYLAPARDGRYDLVVFDRCAPPADALPAANAYFLGAPPPYLGPGPAVSGPAVRGWDANHPVLRNLRALDEVEVADAYELADVPPRTARLVEGDRNRLLLAAVPRGAFTDLVQVFPLTTPDGRWNTNWPLRLSFPLFLRNVLFAVGNVRPAGADAAVRPGEVKPLRVGRAGPVRVTTPAGDVVAVDPGPRADVAFAGTEQPGVYTARWAEAGGDAERRFAVNVFDPLESDLAPAAAVAVGAQAVAADATPRRPPVDLWKVPVALGLAAVLAEWWVYNRRVHV